MDKRRILLVEDDADHRGIIRRAFTMHRTEDFRLVEAASLGEARRELDEHAFDLVIVDWKLRDGSGTELLPGYRQEAALPFLLLTSFDQPDAVADALRKGAVDFLVKSAESLRQVPAYVVRTLREWDIRQTERVHRQRLVSIHKLAELGYYAGHVMTHGMNNVLGAMLNYAESVEEDIQDRRVSTSTLDNVRRMVRLAEDAAKMIKKLRMVTANEARHHHDIFNVEEVVRDRLDILQPLFPPGLQVTFSNPDKVTCYCEGDAEQFRSTVMNLVINAKDAIPKARIREGQIEVILSQLSLSEDSEHLGQWLPAGTYHHLRVVDNGKGIAKRDMPHLLEPFRTTHPDGTGLGLATAKHFIHEKLGGAIWAETEWGKGTTFHMAIPDKNTQPAATSPSLSMGYQGNGELLMLVDDEARFLHSLKQTLEGMNYRIKSFPEARSALSYYTGHWQEVAVVITDKVMPGMHGDSLFKEAQKINPQVQGILITGYGGEQMDAKHAKRLGFSKLLHKPVRKQEIGEALLACISPSKHKGK